MYEKFVGVLLVRKNGEILLQKRDNKKNIAYPNFWSFPSGSLELGESPKKGAERELFEETGYQSKKLKMFKIFYDFHKGEKNSIRIFWDYYDEKSKISCFEGQKIEFLSLNHVLNNEIAITPVAFQAWIRLLMKIKYKFYDY